MGVQRTGNWALARRLLQAAPQRLQAAVTTATRQEAELLRRQIVDGITEQAPGGEPFKPLAALTLAARRLGRFRGTKALLVRADLRNAITIIARGEQLFVGVLRKARSRDGDPLVDVARVQEFGSDPIVIPITAAMRRYLAVLSKEAGRAPSKGTGQGVVVITIPARPFLRPAFKAFVRGAERRLLARVARQLGWGSD